MASVWGRCWHKVGSRQRKEDEPRGFSRSENKNGSNWRELTAGSLSIQSAALRPRNQVLLIETDNLVTKAYINHLGGRMPVLSAIARDIWATAHQFGIQPITVHRPGKFNQRADKLSQWKQDSTDLQLRPDLFKKADRRWGLHSIDLCANRLNRQTCR